ncbi:MAG: translesion error-prone DNA polymerase V autoproteolytic subunit [Paludibacter sp.]|nr:translesion error-prone DNA polymerase V autoproteolytic subunit [Paludibacter sp.]
MVKVKNIVTTGNIDFYSANTGSELALPLVEGGIAAGFPSPAQDYIDLKIDLNKELIANPSSTFYGRVKGSSMQDAGIENGDILVIDKSLEPRDGDTAVCFVDGEFTLKYIKIEPDAVYLIPANSNFKPIKVTEENNFCIWGVVTYSIKNHKRK